MPLALTAGPHHWPVLPAPRPPIGLEPLTAALCLPRLPLTPPPSPPLPRYADINLALNALESAFIQLTGKAEAKGQFFPQMRKRIAARGHKVADYEVCL